ncbi:MAG: helix-turn-helix transcriptional regulator [Nitrospirae bacterium]|nr:helix-turn-helix transcriptional regulator [Nitrospirota bacterium]
MKTFTLGQKIRELREGKDLSLRDLAKTIEVSPAFLSDIELGRRNPSDKKLSSISRALGIPLEELRTYDIRTSMEDFKNLALSDHKFGLAFRKVIDKKISSEELLKFVEKISKIKKT